MAVDCPSYEFDVFLQKLCVTNPTLARVSTWLFFLVGVGIHYFLLVLWKRYRVVRRKIVTPS